MAVTASPKKKARVASSITSQAYSQGAAGTRASPAAEVTIIKDHRPLRDIKNLGLGKTDCSIMVRVLFVSLPHMMKAGIQYSKGRLIFLTCINEFHATSSHIMCGDSLENEAWVISL